MRPSRADRFRSGAILAVIALVAGLSVPGPARAESPPQLRQVGTDALARDSWIVSLWPGSDAVTEAPALTRAVGGGLGHVYRHALNGFQFRGSAAAAEALRRSPRVAAVQPDRAVFLTETLPFGVERLDAFVVGGGGAYQAGFRGAGARIAVLDTGIDLDHPDLAASIDDVSGRNCVNGSLPPNDGYGHGTHVAGSAAAPLNGTGVVGVAPEAALVPIKVFDDAGNSAESIVLCGLDHVVALNTDGVAANDVDVANMSWGEQRAWGDCGSDALHGAICRAHGAGVVLVAGAGNSAVNAGTFVPAAYPEVISVSALTDLDGEPGGLAGCPFIPSLLWTECDDSMAFFSNYGASVDVIAPGVNVYSTWANGGYQVQNGTSMATPHVTGVVALMAALDPGLTPAAALDVLRLSGECPNGQWADADATPGCVGQGTWRDDPDGVPEVLPNALRAAQVVAGGSPPPPPPPPPDPTVPGAPALNTATGGVGSVTLSWSAPVNDGGSAITGYQVWRGESAGDETLLTTLGVQASFVDATVLDGPTYWYQVAAVNAIGPGPRSNELSATTVSTPSAPTLLGAPADRAAALSWTVPADDGGSALTGYNVYRQVGTAPESLRGTTDAVETTFVDFGLTNGTAYRYRVAAVNAAGEGVSSNVVSIVPTAAATAPDAPQSLTAAKAKGSFAVELHWSPPDTDGGSPLAAYFVYRRGPGDESFSFLGSTPDGTTTTFMDATVARRTTYSYYVSAWNAYGPGPPSSQVTIKSK